MTGQIRMDTWSKGRTVLVGDSCFAPAFLSGQGTSLAMIGAYTLAHELAGTDDHHAALLGYERRLRAFVEHNQALALRGSSTVLPKTERNLRTRNRLMKALPLLKLLGLGGFLSRETREASPKHANR